MKRRDSNIKTKHGAKTKRLLESRRGGIPGIPGPPIHHCHNCGKQITRAETAALVDAAPLPGSSQSRQWRWCFDCWDNDPAALAQYQSVGLK